MCLDFSWNPNDPWVICSVSEDNIMQVSKQTFRPMLIRNRRDIISYVVLIETSALLLILFVIGLADGREYLQRRGTRDLGC